MPNKHNADRRNHIAKMKMKVTNWSDYIAGLLRRGSLTRWVTEKAMADWQAQPRLTPGGRRLYSDTAKEASLMLRSAFRMPPRQAEGLMSSVFQLLGVDLPVPDYSTVSPRAMKLPPISVGRLPDGPLHVLIDSTGLKVYGAGEWLIEKHGARARRCWRKLPLAVDANTNMIVASILTEKEVDDPSRVQALLDQIPGDIAQVTADGTYDSLFQR